MKWRTLEDGPIAMLWHGNVIEIFARDDLLKGERLAWLVVMPSQAHAHAGWYRCAAGRGVFEPRPPGRARPPPVTA